MGASVLLVIKFTHHTEAHAGAEIRRGANRYEQPGQEWEDRRCARAPAFGDRSSAVALRRRRAEFARRLGISWARTHDDRRQHDLVATHAQGQPVGTTAHADETKLAQRIERGYTQIGSLKTVVALLQQLDPARFVRSQDLTGQRETIVCRPNAQVDVAACGAEQQMPRVGRHRAHTRFDGGAGPTVEAQRRGHELQGRIGNALQRSAMRYRPKADGGTREPRWSILQSNGTLHELRKFIVAQAVNGFHGVRDRVEDTEQSSVETGKYMASEALARGLARRSCVNASNCSRFRRTAVGTQGHGRSLGRITNR